MWELWKSRNEVVLQHKNFDPIEVKRKVDRWMATARESDDRVNVQSAREGMREMYCFDPSHFQIISDGSWDTTNRAGIAFVIYQGGYIWRIGYSFYELHDPFHAEVLAVKEALLHFQAQMTEERQERLQVFIDCERLVTMVNVEDTDDLPSWRAKEDVVQLINLIKRSPQTITLDLVRREAVQQAHCLANWARRTGARYQGHFAGSDNHGGNIQTTLDQAFFQRVQEAPP
ncbi:hypothetical protein LUZ62_044981 [Rhynchospora pubera]|uniref:RNase H type-1 domain-containing protein n=1 Tax=Rhynchospora pubera TaxID=906938 RepID=A0AAV8FNL7_9POAL|nr:hypothetical protein LUZ62_044981 [Rhynchospora pubera]